uniref:AP-1 complex subunit gamma-2, putative n=1 Tax=Arundo donax TaxID=35708 RepID=A0A0A9EZQ7_ARUDO
MALQARRKIADLALFQSVLAIHLVRHPDTHCKWFLSMLVIGDIEPLCDCTISTSWNNVAASWIQSQLDELQHGFGPYKKHYHHIKNIITPC